MVLPRGGPASVFWSSNTEVSAIPMTHEMRVLNSYPDNKFLSKKCSMLSRLLIIFKCTSDYF